MQIEEIQEFSKSMKLIESFLSELAARDSEIRYKGLGSTKLWKSYEEASSSLNDFDRKLHELIKLSKFIDSDLNNRITTIAADSKVAEGITQIAVTVKIAELRRERDVAVRKVATTTLDIFSALSASLLKVNAFNVNRRELSFNNFDISLSKILVGLNRLIQLTEEVEEIYLAKTLGDDEVFKPANINIDSINIYIENTLNIVTSSAEIGPETKTRLTEYLEDIRLELSQKTPKWKKIVGGLVIVSTILGGLAVAPQAIDNVQNAVQEILGTSIEKQYPHSVPKDKKDTPKLIMT